MQISHVGPALRALWMPSAHQVKMGGRQSAGGTERGHMKRRSSDGKREQSARPTRSEEAAGVLGEIDLIGLARSAIRQIPPRRYLPSGRRKIAEKSLKRWRRDWKLLRAVHTLVVVICRQPQWLLGRIDQGRTIKPKMISRFRLRPTDRSDLSPTCVYRLPFPDHLHPSSCPSPSVVKGHSGAVLDVAQALEHILPRQSPGYLPHRRLRTTSRLFVLEEAARFSVRSLTTRRMSCER